MLARISFVPLAACVAACMLLACGDRDKGDDPVLAEAFGELLYWSDLRRVIAPGTPPEDSAVIATRYIQEWAKERSVLHKAEENIAGSQADIEARMRSYREALIIHMYEQALVSEKLDTVVLDQEVERYYAENTVNFAIKDNIVRVRWFKVPARDPRVRSKVEDLWRAGGVDLWHELELLLARQGIPITDTKEDWMELRELQMQLPMRIANPVDWLPRNARTTVSDSAGTFFVEFLEHRLKNSISPLDMVRPAIRAIIINQRKVQLIARMREDLYNEALEDRDVRIH